MQKVVKLDNTPREHMKKVRDGMKYRSEELCRKPTLWDLTCSCRLAPYLIRSY